MNAEFIEALNAIEKERGISKDIRIRIRIDSGL